MKNVMMITLIISILFQQGCCSLFTSDPQVISVNSKPEGADVKIGPYKGKTPYKITIPRGKEYTIEVKYGDKTEVVALGRSVEGLFWVNILFWPGLIVDMATGKMYKYEPLDYELTFDQK